jgi:hypothetical protein
MLPPSQRQQAKQSPVAKQVQHTGRSSQGQSVGHQVVTPLQVT